MDREQALHWMEQEIGQENLRKHCLAVEAVMRGLAARLDGDPELWGLAGLLHDIDYEQTKDDPDRHSQVGADMLQARGLPAEVVSAVRAHNDRHGLPRRSSMERALFSADPVTGLAVAAALIRPDKKLAAVDVPFLLNRFHEKSFARGARRAPMEACSELGLTLEDFLAIALDAMQQQASQLGL